MTSSTSNYLQAVSQAKSAILFEDSLESSDDHFSSVDKVNKIPCSLNLHFL